MKRVLVVRPWIYDFAAYDLWMQPMGLFYVAAFLRKNGFEVEYMDCLEPYHKFCIGKLKRVEDGRGKFYRTEVEKPLVLKEIPRRYSRYGLPEDVVIRKLRGIGKIDAVLITSMMSYWYLGVKRVVEICRGIFPKVPIILGGVYATLMSEHADKVIEPDLLVIGSLEKNMTLLLDYLLKGNGNKLSESELYPEWFLVNNLKYLPIMTSRGCSFACSYCASRFIYPIFTQREPLAVMNEILYFYELCNIEHIVFYDDALLVNARDYFIKLMGGLKEFGLGLTFHTPNGLHARFIDSEVAWIMKEMNFQTICISLETADDRKNIEYGNKVTRRDFEDAMKFLFEAGFNAGDIDVYLMIGMPNQLKQEIISDIKYVHDNGGVVKLSLFSPIPGTAEFAKLPDHIKKLLQAEPLLQNNSIFSHYFDILDLREYEEVKRYSNELNGKLRKGA